MAQANPKPCHLGFSDKKFISIHFSNHLFFICSLKNFSNSFLFLFTSIASNSSKEFLLKE
ncbi:MAG: hypothetical protein WCG25_05235 [bacterium]